MNRITFAHVNNVVQRNLHQNLDRVSTLQEQLSSGQRIRRPSDDPIGTTNALGFRDTLAGMHQYNRNAKDAQSYLGVIDATLVSANDVVQSIRERAIQGDNDTMKAEDKVYIAQDVRQSLYQLVTIANTTYKGDYVFSGENIDVPPWTVQSGSETIDATDDTATNPDDTFLTGAQLNTPIQIWDRNIDDSRTSSGNALAHHIIPGTVEINNLEEGVDYELDYQNGTITFLTPEAVNEAATGPIQMNYEWLRKTEEDLGGDITRQVDQDVTMQINMGIDDVIGSNTETDMFESVITLLDGLVNNQSDKIAGSMAEIDSSFDRLLAAESTVGSRYNQVSTSLSRMEDKIIETTRIQSEIEDLDFAEAISNFTLAEAVYNASLQSSARVLQPSLIDFV